MDKEGINIGQDSSQEVLRNLSLLEKNIGKINELWAIEDTQIKSNKPIVGRVIVFIKRAIRKSIYWLIKPYWRQQIEFNSAAACAISEIYRILNNSKEENEPAITRNTLEIFEEERSPRIIQLVTSLKLGDAVGNDVIAFKNALLEVGFTTEIYADNIHKKIKPGTAKFFKELPIEKINKDDILIYHFSSQCYMSNIVKDLVCKKVLRFHNITPPYFFKGYDVLSEKATRVGLKQVKELAPYMDYCLPDSKFNENDLKQIGYKCECKVLPIIVQFDDYKKSPNDELIRLYKDGRVNIIFVGRIAPNKKLEDIISIFANYKQNYNMQARLFLIGNYDENDKYFKMIEKHIKKLKVQDIFLPGHVAFEDILAYYNIADIFLCMSEHEGFCVPLIEAMYFKVPIIAFDEAAIKDTLGDSGILIKDKDNDFIAKVINEIMNNDEMRQKIIRRQSERLKVFDNCLIKNQLIKFIDTIQEEDIISNAKVEEK